MLKACITVCTSLAKVCEQTQVAAGTKLQDHDLNLEPVHSSTFLPFSLLHITAVTFSKDKPCKSLVSVGNGFLSTDSVYRSLLKISWQENLMILSTGWLKKFKVYHWTWTKLFLCEKKQAKTMEWTWLHITCCRRMDYPTCQVLGHSMNSSCSVRGVDCEHHKDGEVVNQQIYSTDWAKSHTKEFFSRRPEAGRRYSTTTEGTWRGDPLQICPNDVRHTAPSKCCRSILQVELLMLQSS